MRLPPVSVAACCAPDLHPTASRLGMQTFDTQAISDVGCRHLTISRELCCEYCTPLCLMSQEWYRLATADGDQDAECCGQVSWIIAGSHRSVEIPIVGVAMSARRWRDFLQRGFFPCVPCCGASFLKIQLPLTTAQSSSFDVVLHKVGECRCVCTLNISHAAVFGSTMNSSDLS